MKQFPKWNIWKHVPTLNATEAVALTLNVEPSMGKEKLQRIKEFADRLFLFKKCFGIYGEISLINLAIWSQSVRWNIPIELAALSPIASKEAHENLSTETVLKALTELVVDNNDIDALHSELTRMNVKFIMYHGLAMVIIPDGTVNGKRSPLSWLYSEVRSLCLSGDKLSTLIKGSGASGGGASNANRGFPYPVTEQQKLILNDAPQEDLSTIYTDAGEKTKVIMQLNGVKKAQQNKAELPTGVSKIAIIAKFRGIYWSASQWNKYLASPPQWLAVCRISRGTKSKNNPSIWNPVQIAIALFDKEIPITKLDAVLVSFKDWCVDWEEKSEYLR